MSLVFLSVYTGEQKVAVEEAPKIYRWWEVQKPQWAFATNPSNFLRDPRIHSILPKDYHFIIPDKSNEKALPSGRLSELHALLVDNNPISSNNAITIEKIDKYENENQDTLNVESPNPRSNFTKPTPVRKSMIDMKKIEVHKGIDFAEFSHEAPVTLSVPTPVNNPPQVKHEEVNKNINSNNNNDNNNHSNVNNVAQNETTTPVNNETNHAKETSSAGEVKLRRVAPQKRNVARTLSIQIPKSNTSTDLSKTGGAGLASKPIKKLVIKKKFPEGQPSNPSNVNVSNNAPSVSVSGNSPAVQQQHTSSPARDSDILAKLGKLDDLMEALELDFTEVMVADQWSQIRSIVKDLKTTMAGQGKKLASPAKLPPSSGDPDPIDTLLESL